MNEFLNFFEGLTTGAVAVKLILATLLGSFVGMERANKRYAAGIIAAERYFCRQRITAYRHPCSDPLPGAVVDRYIQAVGRAAGRVCVRYTGDVFVHHRFDGRAVVVKVYFCLAWLHGLTLHAGTDIAV